MGYVEKAWWRLQVQEVFVDNENITEQFEEKFGNLFSSNARQIWILQSSAVVYIAGRFLVTLLILYYKVTERT